MSSWLDDLVLLQSRNQSAISVAVASTKGSAPREAGTRMQVTKTDVFGTIGGGHLEFKAIHIARDLLASGGLSSLLRFPLGASLGQCCGGSVNLLFEPVVPGAKWVNDIRAFQQQGKSCIAVTKALGSVAAGKLLVAADARVGSLGSEALDREAIAIAKQRLATNQSSTLLSIAGMGYFFETITGPDFNIMLFGAGHVGRAVVKILVELPCRIIWIDSREAEFPPEIHHNVEKRIDDFPEEAVAGAAPDSYFLVMSHSHQLDLAICERILLRHDVAYFGLIGSLTKRRQFERRMLARGIHAGRFDNMNCPIGAAGIASKEPMAIAVAVVTELLLRREALQRKLTIGFDSTPISAFPRSMGRHLLPPG